MIFKMHQYWQAEWERLNTFTVTGISTDGHCQLRCGGIAFSFRFEEHRPSGEALSKLRETGYDRGWTIAPTRIDHGGENTVIVGTAYRNGEPLVPELVAISVLVRAQETPTSQATAD